MKTNVRSLTQAAVVAALYAGLTLLQGILLPGTTNQAIQFRLAEALCVLALFSQNSIPALTLGCLLANLLGGSALPLDFMVGTVATLLATLAAYGLRNVRIKGYPLPSLLMPALCNGILVGAELTIFVGQFPLWKTALFVAAGEAAVLLTLGTALFYALSAEPIRKRLMGK